MKRKIYRPKVKVDAKFVDSVVPIEDESDGKGYREVLGWNYFDTLTIDNSNFLEKMKMFVNPMGGYDIGGKVKGECDTNMCMGGMLPAPTEMTVFEIRTEIVLDNPDTQRYIRNGLLEFWVGNKLYHQSPLSFVNRTVCYTALDIAYQRCFYVSTSCRKFDVESLIKFRVYLHGRVKRGIC